MILTPKQREEIMDKFAKWKLCIERYDEEPWKNDYDTKKEAEKALKKLMPEGSEQQFVIAKEYIIIDNKIIAETERIVEPQARKDEREKCVKEFEEMIDEFNTEESLRAFNNGAWFVNAKGDKVPFPAYSHTPILKRLKQKLLNNLRSRKRR